MLTSLTLLFHSLCRDLTKKNIFWKSSLEVRHKTLQSFLGMEMSLL